MLRYRLKDKSSNDFFHHIYAMKDLKLVNRYLEQILPALTVNNSYAGSSVSKSTQGFVFIEQTEK